jgi:hypothetical protein
VPPGRGSGGAQSSDVARTALRRDKSPAAPIVVACASGSAPGPIAYAAADIAIAPFLASWSGSHHSTSNDIAQVRPSADC